MIYQLDLDDEIAYDPVNFANINLDQTRRKGVITSGRWQQSKKLGYTASYTFTDAEVLRGPFAGRDIPLVARHSALLGSDYQLTDTWQLYGELFAISDRVFAGDGLALVNSLFETQPPSGQELDELQAMLNKMKASKARGEKT